MSSYKSRKGRAGRPNRSARGHNPPRHSLMQPELVDLPPAPQLLPPPFKSASDKKSYRVIKLPNGLTATLVSDPSPVPAPEDTWPHLLNQNRPQIETYTYPYIPPETDTWTRTGDPDDEELRGPHGHPELVVEVQEYVDADDSDDSDDSDTSSSSEEDRRSIGGEAGDTDAASMQKYGLLYEDKAAACALCIGVGSYSDPPAIQGLAHFVEHMVFMGSAKYPVENDFDSFIRRKGGNDNAQTDCEKTTFYFELQEDFLNEGMDRFSQFFVAPLMKQEAMQRERESIESEFALASPIDSNRRDRIVCSTLAEGHPGRIFMWGNCRSLTRPVGPADDELHRRAHAFRKRHYSAHRMTVAVQARLPLDTLERYVADTFGQIPTNSLPPDDFSAYAFTPETITPEFHSFYRVKPMMQTNNLTLTWCMKSFLGDYKTKPHQYVGWIVGHEGTGSLLLYLQRKVWALGIYSGVSDTEHTSVVSFFSLMVVLTQEGLKNVEKVMDACFGYINMLKRDCPSERIFRELQKIEEVTFRFKDEPQPYDHVEHLAENMQHLPSEHYMSGVDMYFEYDPDGIMYVINNMSPETVNIMLQSQNYSEPVQYDAVEEWFGTEYKKSEIPKESIERWKNVKPIKEFHLPEPNLYIPDNFDLIPVPPDVLLKKKAKLAKPEIEVPPNANDPFLFPELIKHNDSMEVWYKPDYKFDLPYTYVNVHFNTPLTTESPKTACLLDLWCLALNQLSNEKLYPADMIGMNRSLQNDDNGVTLTVSGFSQKILVIVNEMTKMFKRYNDKLTEELFDALKDIQIKAYTNSVMKPNKLVKEIRLSIITGSYWATLEKLKNLKITTYNDLKVFGEKFADKLYVKILIQGNLVKKDAWKISETIRANLQWTGIPYEERPKPVVYQIPIGEKHCRISSFNKDDENSIVTNYYQYGVGDLKNNCIVELISLLMEEPLFNTLRTKEQLGYSVYGMMRFTSGVLGYSITVNVQAGKFCTGYVDQRIEAFLKKFLESVRTMSFDTYDQTRTALIKLKNGADVELKDELKRNWDEILNNEYQFNRLLLEIECIKNLTQQEIVSWLENNLKCGNKSNFRKLSVQIAGHEQKKGEVSKHVEKKVKLGEQLYVVLHECDYSIKYLDEACSPFFIRDIGKFKSSLTKYPERPNGLIAIVGS